MKRIIAAAAGAVVLALAGLGVDAYRRVCGTTEAMAATTAVVRRVIQEDQRMHITVWTSSRGTETVRTLRSEASSEDAWDTLHDQRVARRQEAWPKI